MPSDPAILEPGIRRRRRVRFSLKTLLVLVTLLCIWLGWNAARQRRAAQIIALNHAVLDQLQENFTTEPDRTKADSSPSARQRRAKFFARTRNKFEVEPRSLTRFWDGGRFHHFTTLDETLDTADVNAQEQRATVTAIYLHNDRLTLW
jgi:cell division protein FtsB